VPARSAARQRAASESSRRSAQVTVICAGPSSRVACQARSPLDRVRGAGLRLPRSICGSPTEPAVAGAAAGSQSQRDTGGLRSSTRHPRRDQRGRQWDRGSSPLPLGTGAERPPRLARDLPCLLAVAGNRRARAGARGRLRRSRHVPRADWGSVAARPGRFCTSPPGPATRRRQRRAASSSYTTPRADHPARRSSTAAVPIARLRREAPAPRALGLRWPKMTRLLRDQPGILRRR
jgi:hypothetical protein